MIATLPMYDRPETAATNDALWAEVAKRVPNAPASLDRSAPLEETWTRADLVLSQTCGLSFIDWVNAHATYVASPDLRLPGTQAGHYYSFIVTRADETRAAEDLLGARPVINQTHSQSGYTALWTYAESLNTGLGALQISGGHIASARAIADNRADIAAIDANTWRLISRHDGWANRLHIIDETPRTPAPPFICGPGQSADALYAALSESIAALTDAQRDTLGLYGITTLLPQDYDALRIPPDVQTRATT